MKSTKSHLAVKSAKSAPRTFAAALTLSGAGAGWMGTVWSLMNIL